MSLRKNKENIINMMLFVKCGKSHLHAKVKNTRPIKSKKLLIVRKNKEVSNKYN